MCCGVGRGRRGVARRPPTPAPYCGTSRIRPVSPDPGTLPGAHHDAFDDLSIPIVEADPASALADLLRELARARCSTVLAQENAPGDGQQPRPDRTAAKLPPEQLDSLVAPIALYPDPLLAQTLVASTYPLEIIQLQQWLAKNPGLKDKALADAVAKQPWDPSIQSMAAVPDVVKRLADDIQWTTDLGNAFLAQQSDVMDAVQRMRKKAKDNGALESNEQQKVETKVVEKKTVIVVEPTNPEVIYVPSYSPTVVYGPPVYPYPPIYYPPYTAGRRVRARSASA